MATRADDYQGFQERFRIRRGKEICRPLDVDLRACKLSPQHPGCRNWGLPRVTW
jgi:hypothetical protein